MVVFLVFKGTIAKSVFLRLGVEATERRGFRDVRIFKRRRRATGVEMVVEIGRELLFGIVAFMGAPCAYLLFYTTVEGI